MASKKLLRILVPVLIVAAVAGIWLYKDHQTKAEALRQRALVDDPAFVLQETSFDLAAFQAHKLPLILHFGSDDCPPCQAMRPALESTHQKMLGKAVIKYFDVWKQPELAMDYPVRVVPTQVFVLADGSPYEPSKSVEDSGIEFLTYEDRETHEHKLTVHEGMLDEAQFQLILNDMGVPA